MSISENTFNHIILRKTYWSTTLSAIDANLQTHISARMKSFMHGKNRGMKISYMKMKIFTNENRISMHGNIVSMHENGFFSQKIS